MIFDYEPRRTLPTAGESWGEIRHATIFKAKQPRWNIEEQSIRGTHNVHFETFPGKAQAARDVGEVGAVEGAGND